MLGIFSLLSFMVICLVAATTIVGLTFCGMVRDKKYNNQWDYTFSAMMVILLIFGWKVFIDYASGL